MNATFMHVSLIALIAWEEILPHTVELSVLIHGASGHKRVNKSDENVMPT